MNRQLAPAAARPPATILVVDDMAVFREPIAMSLRHQGYNTLMACDGLEALAIVAERRPDLILLDIGMPGLDGMACLRRLRAEDHSRDIPVILLTAANDRGLVIEAAKLGVRDYLLKAQFSLAQLRARVSACLAGTTVGAACQRPTPPDGAQPVATPRAAAQAVVTPAAAAPPGVAAQPASPSGAPPASVAPRPQVARAAPAPPQAPVVPVPAPVPMGSGVDGLKALKPLITRSQIEEQVAKLGEIQALSPTAHQIIQITGSPRTSMEDVVRLVRQDQAIALKILKLANSVVYTRGEAVESVHKAVMRIGLAQIRQAVINLAVVERFHADDLGDHLSTPQFWEHSIGCGLIAAEIAHSTGGTPADADRAFTMGLLHDVGRMVYAEQIHDVYRTVLETAAALALPVEQVESRMLLVNHADLMDRVLTLWRFPRHLITPIALHHLSIGNIRHLAPNMEREIASLVLANGLCHALLIGSSGNLAVYPTHELAHSLKLGADVIQKIVAQTPDQAQDIKLAMLSSTQAAHWQPLREQVREQIGVPLHPLVVSEHADVDAVAILGGRLHDPISAPERPNIGIVHITQASERQAVTHRLLEAEAKAQAGPLPLVVFSPGGTLTITESPSAGRRTVLLTCPVALSRVVAGLRSLLAPAGA